MLEGFLVLVFNLSVGLKDGALPLAYLLWVKLERNREAMTKSFAIFLNFLSLSSVCSKQC